MQYLLTEEEMQAIRGEREAARKMPHPEALKNVVQHAACFMVDKNPANGRPKLDRPHGCIHIKDSLVFADRRMTPSYCDDCSMQGICPLPKSWSK